MKFRSQISQFNNKINNNNNNRPVSLNPTLMTQYNQRHQDSASPLRPNKNTWQNNIERSSTPVIVHDANRNNSLRGKLTEKYFAMIRDIDNAIIEDDIQPRRVFIMQGNRLKINLVLITGVSVSVNNFIAQFLIPAM